MIFLYVVGLVLMSMGFQSLEHDIGFHTFKLGLFLVCWAMTFP